MDIKHLTYILTIAQEKNMTKAAEKLFVSQSSLSHYLSRLESEIGTSLFLRGKNELIPTPAGQMYLDAASKMIQIRNQLYQNIHNLDNRGHIRISATSQWGLRMISDIIPRFKEAFPDVTFELSHLDVDILEKMIDEEKLDFALVSISAKENLNPTSEILRKEEMLFAVPANDPYCKKNPSNEITEEELAHTFYNTNFFLSKKGTANRTLGDQLFSRHNLALTSLCEVNGMIMTRDMVAQGIGAAFIPTSCRADEEHVHYYSLSPKLYRYNALMHRKNLVLNQPEQLFYSYVMNYFNDDMESI